MGRMSPLTEDPMIGAGDVVRWLRELAARVSERRDQLTELDAAIGDADHGVNMDRGLGAVTARLDEGASQDAPAVLKLAGMTLVSTVGGAAGPLYGTFFLEMAKAAAGSPALAPAQWAAAVTAGVRGVQARGKAEPGDKTMVDALLPAAAALEDELAGGATLAESLAGAAAAAEAGMRATTPLVARKGRASYLGERSAGHQDPGATSSWLLVAAMAALVPGAG
jgi:dihydroxyacetone kinase-like protein